MLVRAAALAERLPPYRCEEFVFLSPPVEATPAKLKFLYGQLKKVFSSGEVQPHLQLQLGSLEAEQQQPAAVS